MEYSVCHERWTKKKSESPTVPKTTTIPKSILCSSNEQGWDHFSFLGNRGRITITEYKLSFDHGCFFNRGRLHSCSVSRSTFKFIGPRLHSCSVQVLNRARLHSCSVCGNRARIFRSSKFIIQLDGVAGGGRR